MLCLLCAVLAEGDSATLEVFQLNLTLITFSTKAEICPSVVLSQNLVLASHMELFAEQADGLNIWCL